MAVLWVLGALIASDPTGSAETSARCLSAPSGTAAGPRGRSKTHLGGNYSSHRQLWLDEYNRKHVLCPNWGTSAALRGQGWLWLVKHSNLIRLVTFVNKWMKIHSDGREVQLLPVNCASLLSLAAWRDPVLSPTVLRRPLWAQRWRSLLLSSAVSSVRRLRSCRCTIFVSFTKVWTSEEPVPTCMRTLSTRPLLPFLWKRAETQRRRKEPPHEDQSRVRNTRNKNRRWKDFRRWLWTREFVPTLGIIHVLFSCKFLVLFWRTQHLPAVQQDRVFWWAHPSLSVGFVSQAEPHVR